MNAVAKESISDRQRRPEDGGGLGRRLLRSHVLVATVGLSMLVIALLLFLWQRHNAVLLANIHGPSATRKPSGGPRNNCDSWASFPSR